MTQKQHRERGGGGQADKQYPHRLHPLSPDLREALTVALAEILVREVQVDQHLTGATVKEPPHYNRNAGAPDVIRKG